jgi:hypothetical protein
MECGFYVGQKIVCVDADGFILAKPLELNRVYTVRKLFQGTHPKTGQPGIGVCLVEVVNPPDENGLEPVYRHLRFRPATDISCLEKLLATRDLKELVW